MATTSTATTTSATPAAAPTPAKPVKTPPVMMKLYRPNSGIEFQYKEPVESNPALAQVLCIVCKGPVLDPMTHLECGGTFCASCSCKSSQCPQCSSEMLVHQKVPVRALTMLQLVDSLEVVCPTCKTAVQRKLLNRHWNHCPQACPLGCGVSVTPLDFEIHRDNVCTEQEISCKLCGLTAKRNVILAPDHKDSCPIDCVNGCGQRVAPKDFARHDEVCPETIIPCPRCATKVKRGKFSGEHVPICPIDCPCGEKIAPKDMAEHERSGCKMAPVKCSAASVLCPWIGPKPSLPDHEKTCRFLALKDLLGPIMDTITTGGASLPYNNKGKDLSGQDLSRKVMRGWNFAGANLSGCNLEMCDLSMADFTGANLTGANLIQAKLKGANLTTANAAGAIMVGATFRGADLTKCILRGCNLMGADLSNTTITGLDVSHANMIGVKRNMSASGSKAVGGIGKAIEQWPKNFWKQLTNLDIVFSDNNLTVTNTTNNTQSTFAEYGIPPGCCFTWKVKVGAVDCSHAGVGVAKPSASIGRGNHGDGTGSWKWQAGGSAYINGSCNDTGQRFGAGDVLTCFCDRRKEPTLFTITKNNDETNQRKFTISAEGEVLIPFVGACCRGNIFTADFSTKQPTAIELPGALNLETATFIDPAVVAAQEAAEKEAAAKAASTIVKPRRCLTSKWADDCWRHLSGNNAVFSNGDLTVTNTTNTTQSTCSKMPIPNGTARFWSITIHNSSCDSCGFGVVHENKVGDMANNHANTSNCWKMEATGKFFQNGTTIDGNERFRTGDLMCILVDRRPNKHTITFYKNGRALKTLTGLPATSDNLFPSITPCCTNDSFTVDFCAVPSDDTCREIPELAPPPPPPVIDVTLYHKDTWRPLEGLDLEFSNNAATVTNPGKKTQCTISLYGIAPGVQRYWEVMIDVASCSASGIAVIVEGAPIGLNSYADKTGCWKWERIGRFLSNGVAVSQLANACFVEGDRLGVFVDRTPSKGTVTFYKNGEEITVLTGLPNEPTAPTVYPCVIPCCGGASFTGLFGAPMPPTLEAAIEAAKEAANAAAAASATTAAGGH